MTLADLEMLVDERSSIVRSIKELEAFVSARRGSPLTAHLKWREYHNEVAVAKHRLRDLGERAAALKAQIRSASSELGLDAGVFA